MMGDFGGDVLTFFFYRAPVSNIIFKGRRFDCNHQRTLMASERHATWCREFRVD